MRTDKELLSLLRDRTEALLDTDGLCYVNKKMRFLGDINNPEEARIDWIIDNYADRVRGSEYSWPRGEVAPRIEWINRMLERIKEGRKL